MYRPSHFQLNDRQAQLDVIQQFSLGTLVTTFQGKLEINQIPFLVNATGSFLEGHFAKANPHWKLLEQADDLKVCFSGENAYISPNWYEDKRYVPTWNYVSVQVSGKAELMNEAELLDLLVRLSAKNEAQFEQPWTIDKMEPRKLSAMLRAIVGFRISIDEIHGKIKLSQNKTNEEVEQLATGLDSQQLEQSSSIARLMRQKKART